MINSPIQFAINYTKIKIPLKLIKLAIDSYKHLNSPFNNSNISTIEGDMEKYILHEIITPRANVEAGKIKECVLTQSMVVPTSYRESDMLYRTSINTLYEIPPEEREFRDISKVICVKYKTISGVDTPFNAINNSSSLVKQARAMLGAQTFDDAWVPPNAELVGNNMVRLAAPIVNHVNWIVQFMLNYPDTYENIERSSWEPFADLMVYATQMFIYNNLVIDIDQAAMRSGIQIGSIKDLIYEYKDAEEKFREAMNSFIATERFDEKFQMEMYRLML